MTALLSKSKFAEWALLGASIFFALVLVELFCRIALPRPGFAPPDPNTMPGVIQPHPTRLYRLAPDFSIMLTGGMYKRMRVETNSAGLREPPLERLGSSKFRILAIGDSFTFGVGIDATQTWPVQLEHILAVQSRGSSIAVVNGGVPGYGLAQMRDLTEELRPKLNPHLVILAVYAGGFDRMLDPYTALGNFAVRSSSVYRMRVVDGGVVTSSTSSAFLAPADLWLKSHWYSGAYAYDSVYALLGRGKNFVNSLHHADTAAADQAAATALRKGLAEISRIKRITSDRGVPLLVLLVGSFDMKNRPEIDQQATNNIVRSFCSAEKIPIVDPISTLLSSREPLRVNEGDYHWSAEANALVAKQLASPALSLMVGSG
jgi:hypothetical protein